MSKKWKKDELTYLKRYAKGKRLSELAERFERETDEVSDQLEEMGLAAKDSVTRQRIEHDPHVKVFEKGVRALHKQEWKQAAKEFETVVEETDRPQLRARALQFLDASRAQLDRSDSGEAEDPFLQAVYLRNRGDLEEALDLCVRGGRQGKDDRFAFLAASIHALSGDLDQAAELLHRAIEMDPKNRIHAHYDSDFAALREEPRYAEIFESA